MDKGRGRGVVPQKLITKLIIVNFNNFANVDKGVGGKTLINNNWIICQVFILNPSLPDQPQASLAVIAILHSPRAGTKERL